MDFLDNKKIKGLNKNVFWSSGVSYATSYKILKPNNPRTFKNYATRKKSKGQKKVVTADQIRKIEKVLQDKNLKGRVLMEIAGNGGKSRSFRMNN